MQPSRLAAAIKPTLIREITSRARPTSLHLGLGQPDLALPETAQAALRDVKTAPYTANRGCAQLVDAVVSKYRRNRGALTATSHDIGAIVTCGVQEALAVSILGLVDAGDDVLVPDPGFPAYPNLVRAAGATPVPYRLGPDFALDAALVEEAWTDNTVAIVLNSPSNPTGAVASAGQTERVVRICEERGGFWISDEIYEDFVWVGEHHSPADFGADGIVVSGISKSHSAMGLRIGWLLGAGAVVSGLVPLHQHLVTCAPTVSQTAAVAMLAGHSEQVERIRAVFERRRRLTRDALADWPDVAVPPLDGAFYAFVDVSAHLSGGSSLELALEILDQVDVVTIPGVGFGPEGEGYLRLAYTVDDTILEEALARVGNFLKTRSSR